MMNPGFVNSDRAREKVWIFGNSYQIFQTHRTTMLHFFGPEEMRNKCASFQAPLLKYAELTFLACVDDLPTFEWMNGGLLQSPLTLHCVLNRKNRWEKFC